MNKQTDKDRHKKLNLTKKSDERHQAALDLYRTTKLPMKVICDRTNTPYGAFRSYIYRCHRELMFARYSRTVSEQEAKTVRLHKPSGQRPETYAKYKDAIRACDSIEYIEYNISQVAHIFHLNPTSLGQQLRVHYPEILERREKERHRLGINDNLHRGMRPWCKEQYVEAVEHLRTTDDTIQETAELFNISYSGLREHLLYYHKDLGRKRTEKRVKAKNSAKKRGALTGNGTRHLPSPMQVERYQEALRLYKDTAMTLKEIAEKMQLPLNGLRNHIRIWHRELILERRGIENPDENINLSDTKHYLKSTAAKYADAIRRLKESGLPTAEVAREFGFNPETFRNYLHEHEPELAARLGMVRLRDGKLVSARSMEKYMEAVHIYETTSEPLKSIARRLSLQYNSVGGFVRRNHPEVIEKHNRLVEEENHRKQVSGQAEAEELARRKEEEERQRIIQALEQTGNNRRQAAKLLGICKSTLYNKLKNIDLPK